MPNKKTSSSDSDRGSHRRKKQSRRRSSSSSDGSSDWSVDAKGRHRASRRSRSRSRDRSRRQRSRSASRSPRKRSRRSRSSSRGKSHGSKRKKSYHRHKSRSKSPSKSKGSKASHSQSSPGPHEKDEGTLKMKIQQVLKAAANANAELREKGLLPSRTGTELSQPSAMSISDQMKRAQAIEDINAPSFSQQTFLSSRTTGKQVSEKGTEDPLSDAHSAAIFGMASPKLGISSSADASIKKLESWKENPEMLVHENLFADQSGKEERWKKKLMALRRKNINGELYI